MTPGRYIVLAPGIAIATIPPFGWMFSREGIVSEEDRNGMVLIAPSVTRFMIVWLTPREASRSHSSFLAYK